ncbi:hypothetical protein CEXT_687001 [Caerostris extrusa]|uniref:Uncharacterized protein n=1 Tax=Caerostris extrusa TaxID=172846 RepID=A0AAV4MEW0_CAEEX|nr:hypothetical protein CEXT_687001 [Caerostris extrusa]
MSSLQSSQNLYISDRIELGFVGVQQATTKENNCEERGHSWGECLKGLSKTNSSLDGDLRIGIQFEKKARESWCAPDKAVKWTWTDFNFGHSDSCASVVSHLWRNVDGAPDLQQNLELFWIIKGNASLVLASSTFWDYTAISSSLVGQFRFNQFHAGQWLLVLDAELRLHDCGSSSQCDISHLDYRLHPSPNTVQYGILSETSIL